MQELNNKTGGDELSAAEWNQMPSELQNLITAYQIVLSGGDLNQVGKALANLAASGNYYRDTGSSTAYVLEKLETSSGDEIDQQPPTLLVEGMVVRFKANQTSTITNPTLNLVGLGAIVILNKDGSALSIGQIATGQFYAVQYNGTNWLLDSNPAGTGGGGSSTHNSVLITADGTWNRPPGVIIYKVTAIGGGGGGGGAYADRNRKLFFGGNGGSTAIGAVGYFTDSSLTIVVGQGGNGGDSETENNIPQNGSFGTSTNVTGDDTGRTLNGLGGGAGQRPTIPTADGTTQIDWRYGQDEVSNTDVDAGTAAVGPNVYRIPGQTGFSLNLTGITIDPTATVRAIGGKSGVWGVRVDADASTFYGKGGAGGSAGYDYDEVEYLMDDAANGRDGCVLIEYWT